MTQLAIGTATPNVCGEWHDFLSVVGGNIAELQDAMRLRQWHIKSQEHTEVYRTIGLLVSNAQHFESEAGRKTESREIVTKFLRSDVANLQKYESIARRFSFGD